MIPQTTELSQIQAAFIDKDNRIEELMRQINSAQSLLNSLKETMNSLVGDGKITIQTYTGNNVGDFTVNQKEDKTITLPQQATVNNGKLTIKRNGTSVGTFTANQSEDTTVNISVPTKTSEITNDSDFVSDANYVHTDNNFTNADKAEIGKINNSLQFTYVIDSNQKLADWANNVVGNDYTAILIKAGNYTLNVASTNGINLTQTGTKVIIGEVGSVITLINDYRDPTTQTGILLYFHYETLPTNISYLIYNVTLNYSTKYFVPSGQHNHYAFYNCRSVKKCKLTNVNTGSTGKRGTSYYNCYDIEDSEATDHTGATNSFLNCFLVRNCKANKSYSNSYFSPTAITGYECANTLNGGWNTTV